MLRFIKSHMTSIDGISIYPIVSLLIFVLFFTALIIWVVRTDKKTIDEVSKYPLIED